MVDNPNNPEYLFETAVAYWRSSVMFSAIETGIFDVIDEAGSDAASVAERCGFPLRTVSPFLDALTSLNFIELNSAKYFLTASTRQFLTKASPGYIGQMLMFNAQTTPAWHGLTKFIKTENHSLNPDTILGEDPNETKQFVLSMHNRALTTARCLVDLLDLQGYSKLLDIGGGPATYSRLFCEKYSQLNATVLDVDGVVDVAKSLIQKYSVKEQINFIKGDAFTDAWPKGYDVVLISGVLHRTEGESTRLFLQKAYDSLEPGGILAVSDVMTHTGEDHGPVIPELFTLHMMLTAEEGRSIPLPELKQVAKEIGFTYQSIKLYPAPLPHTLCILKKN